jgi:tetratricopeptide (TPR) repeat protein
LARELGFAEGVAKALLELGTLLRQTGGWTVEVQTLLQEALESDFSRLDADFRARVLFNLAMFHARKVEPAQAEDYLRKARSAINESGNRFLEGWSYKYHGYEKLLKGDYQQAESQFELASEAFSHARNPRESQLCKELASFSKAPTACQSTKAILDSWKEILSSIGGLVSASGHQQTRIREAAKALMRLEQLWDATGQRSLIPELSATREVAEATLELLRILHELSDPRPLARIASFWEEFGRTIDAANALIERRDFSQMRAVLSRLHSLNVSVKQQEQPDDSEESRSATRVLLERIHEAMRSCEAPIVMAFVQRYNSRLETVSKSGINSRSELDEFVAFLRGLRQEVLRETRDYQAPDAARLAQQLVAEIDKTLGTLGPDPRPATRSIWRTLFEQLFGR